MQIEKEQKSVFRLNDDSLVLRHLRSWKTSEKLYMLKCLWDVDTTFQYQGFHV